MNSTVKALVIHIHGPLWWMCSTPSKNAVVVDHRFISDIFNLCFNFYQFVGYSVCVAFLIPDSSTVKCVLTSQCTALFLSKQRENWVLGNRSNTQSLPPSVYKTTPTLIYTLA